MFQYRQILVRLHTGDTIRETARSGLMGRDKPGTLRIMALAQGRLDADAELPSDEVIACAMSPVRVREWAKCEVGVRKYGTTHEQPLVLFAIECPLLQRLPEPAPDLGIWHKVVLHRDCYVQYDKALYSAPYTLVGKTLWLRATY